MKIGEEYSEEQERKDIRELTKACWRDKCQWVSDLARQVAKANDARCTSQVTKLIDILERKSQGGHDDEATGGCEWQTIYIDLCRIEGLAPMGGGPLQGSRFGGG